MSAMDKSSVGGLIELVDPESRTLEGFLLGLAVAFFEFSVGWIAVKKIQAPFFR